MQPRRVILAPSKHWSHVEFQSALLIERGRPDCMPQPLPAGFKSFSTWCCKAPILMLSIASATLPWKSRLPEDKIKLCFSSPIEVRKGFAGMTYIVRKQSKKLFAKISKECIDLPLRSDLPSFEFRGILSTEQIDVRHLLLADSFPLPAREPALVCKLNSTFFLFPLLRT